MGGVTDRPKKTLFITGDSTTGLNPPSERYGNKVSWGDVFGDQVDEAVCKFQNEAIPGFSLRDFFHRGRIKEIFRKAKEGDILLACHGHLEGTPLTRENDRARGCLPGIGDHKVIVYDAFFDREEVIRTFEWYVKEYIRICREAGVVLVLLSPPVRCVWVNGKISRVRSLGFAQIMKTVSDSLGAIFLDFGSITEIYLNSIGPKCGNLLYLMEDDQIHTNSDGARVFSKLLASSLLNKYPEALGKFLKLSPPTI
ncbi:MAG TPA: hypothetical protein VHC50_12490 [Puia sp.]|nr:hypothetical protein [Puia sp.]